MKSTMKPSSIIALLLSVILIIGAVLWYNQTRDVDQVIVTDYTEFEPLPESMTTFDNQSNESIDTPTNTTTSKVFPVEQSTPTIQGTVSKSITTPKSGSLIFDMRTSEFENQVATLSNGYKIPVQRGDFVNEYTDHYLVLTGITNPITMVHIAHSPTTGFCKNFSTAIACNATYGVAQLSKSPKAAAAYASIITFLSDSVYQTSSFSQS
jgi:hypothetical protein